MSWRAVVDALERHERFRSRVSPYLHPLAGRAVIWHVLQALLDSRPAPTQILVLHPADLPLRLPGSDEVRRLEQGVCAGDEARALRAAVTPPGATLLMSGIAPLITPATIARLLRAGEFDVAALASEGNDAGIVAVAGEGPALASADDPWRPAGAQRVAATTADELLRVGDRRAFGIAATAVRDRVIRRHQEQGVTFFLPETTWIDADVRIGPDTVIYPNVVIEGTSSIGGECVIGPFCRIVDARIGRGVEMQGWNYIVRTAIRNQAVVEPYVRRGHD